MIVNRFLALVLGVVAALISLPGLSQQYPTKPIRVVIGFGAGSTDAIARHHAQYLSKALNATILVENKPSAGQIVAITTLLQAPADGYTLYFASGSALAQAPAVRNDLPFDPLKDFTYIGLVAVTPGVFVVNQDISARSLRELVNFSIANPDKISYGSSGIGTASHLQIEYLKSLTGLKATHIPFKSASDIMTAMMGRNIQLSVTPIEGSIAAIQGGKIRAIAVSSSRRQKIMPEVPSISELDFKGLEGIDPYSFFGLVGARNLSPSIVSTVNGGINRVLKMPEVVTFMQDRLFSEPGGGTPAAFRTYVENDLAKWKGLAKVINLQEDTFK